MTRTSHRKAPASSRPGSPDDELDLGRYLGILQEHRGSIVATMVLTLGVGLLYMAAATPIYRAHAVLQIEKKANPLGELGALLADFSGEAPTEIELLGSRALLGKVIDELRLEVSATPRYFPLLGAALARGHEEAGIAEPPWALERFAWGGERIQVERVSVPRELEDIPLQLVTGEGGTYTLLDPDSQPLLSGNVGVPAASAPDSVLRVELLVSELQARPGTQFWVTRRSRLEVVEGLQRALRPVEKGLNTGVLSVSLEGRDPVEISAILTAISKHYVRHNVERRSEEVEQTLAFLDTQLPGLRKELERAEAALSAHRAGKGSVDLGLEAQAILERSVDVEKAISELTLERSELRQRFTQNHPVLNAMSSKLARLRADRTALNAKLKGLPDAELTAARLVRDVNVANELYIQLNNKAQEYRVLKSSIVGNARILDEPVVTRLPVRPSKPGVLAVSLVLGLTLGVAFAFTRQALHRGISDPAALEAALGVPVYATVPLGEAPSRRARRKRGADSEGPTILARTRPHDLATESLRSLRTRLQMVLEDAPNNVIAITGTSPGVGASFVSANLAWVLADSGKRVLLVDANLRGGGLHRCFGVARSRGLAEVLEGALTLEQSVVQVPDQSLFFLPTGALPSNPAELLLGDAFKTLVARMSLAYDLVLLDTPPILAVTDAALVGRQAGVNLAVVRAGAHPLREVAAALTRLSQDGVSVQGVVFNGVPRSPSGRAVRGIYQYEYPTVS
ncbi:polysaccharide biosynthesis tyrosine autokinase [Hyalangium rubrum]|uniref:Polysaccharide biosynthesis tyrosine autokinase n=1 Tax=Hyalangium rubrum TaxID=3103134 RepID=A0ABU5H3S1_9BACT|nr:polysaccharide biosynthesis tyrosine autokinase [Hyalangium sp. s54d21]MDY7228113.1 polysaccharide biosynthesis tyrosine autokinase [Hyalangium sp. s54d21]